VDAIFTQHKRVLKITTPLGPDVLLLAGFSGQEAISSLFQFHLDLLAENRRQINFDELLGKKVAIEVMLPDDKIRCFNGCLSSFSQGARDQRFTRYRAEMVPQFWFLTRNAQSRIFQHLTVPDILKKVLQGVDVAYELKGNYQPRDYCVQYRESDFNFASRLMEEEGIYYFFKHAADSHKMVLADTPQSHVDLGKIPYEEVGGGTRTEERMHRWEKIQDLRSGKFTLWDHCFELPGKHLEAEKAVIDSVSAGTVTHKLKVGGNDKFEIYDYPGGYAQRFDGVDAGGGDSAGDLQKIFEDNKRTVGIRMQQETLPALVINGASNCRHLVSGYKFTLADHFNANGSYVLTSISHVAQQGLGTGGNAADSDSHYSNVFTCIPFALPFRPLCSTPEPFVHGSHTATVVGPAGEEIFTDKYSRVKVQFHWDRQGKNDADSSCWVRVGTPWAGQNWGIIHIPRIGQEVIVDFLEGDPDQPIIVGSVYNADQMPPYKLPDNKTQSGIKSRSSLHGGTDDFNELRLEDKKGSEDIYFHAQKDFHRVVENDDDLKVGHDQTIEIKHDRTETVKEGNEKVTIAQGNRNVEISMGNDTLKIKMGNQQTNIDLGKSETEAMQSIELKVGQSSVKLDQLGVTIKGMTITIEGQLQVQMKGLITQIQGTAILKEQGGIIMIN
jgi:type VI secretion system secreted protein VgrG